MLLTRDTLVENLAYLIILLYLKFVLMNFELLRVMAANDLLLIEL